MAKIGLNPDDELIDALAFAKKHFDNMQKEPVFVAEQQGHIPKLPEDWSIRIKQEFNLKLMK